MSSKACVRVVPDRLHEVLMMNGLKRIEFYSNLGGRILQTKKADRVGSMEIEIRQYQGLNKTDSAMLIQPQPQLGDFID